MPCYDHRDSPSYIEENTIRPLRERNDLYANWLCWLLDPKGNMPADLAEWADEHRKFDKERRDA